MKAYIIDDERNSRELLRKMLEQYCEGVEVLGVAADAQAGIQLLHKQPADLVFLDLEMPGGDGMAVLDAFPDADFRFVLVTGYPKKRLPRLAVQVAAWLHKPLHLDTLRNTVGLLQQENGLAAPAASPGKTPAPAEVAELILPGAGSYGRITFSDVAYVEAHRAYALFHLTSGATRLASQALGHYEMILPTDLFFRIHKSYLVNVQQVQGFDAGKGGQVFLLSGAKLPIAQRRKSAFVRFIKAHVAGK